MSYLSAVILGAVEGLTEFLPVSSTGHMIIAGRLMGLPATAALGTFEIVVQLGAIAAVAVTYARVFLKSPAVVKRVAVAFVPTAIIGFVLYKGVKAIIGNADIVAWSLLLGGVFILAFETSYARGGTGDGPCGIAMRLRRLGRRLFPERPLADLGRMSWRQAAGVGVCQALAMVPGVSRSAATIIGGLALGLDRRAIVEFSFLLAAPTMLAAAGYDLLKSAPALSPADLGPLLVGSAIAFATALAVMRWFIGYVQAHDLRAFGWYRIAAALLYWLIVA
jgi:undecaprenyl-diphosphatase